MHLPSASGHPQLDASAPPRAQRLRRGCLIVFEGIDGAGKTTQARLLCDRLQREGYDVVSLKEPTDGPWGAKIRQIAQRGRHGIDPSTELEWFIEDRRENVAHNILPALAKRLVVLQDRYYFSTMAYQGALGRNPESIQKRNEAFAPVPDLVFLLEIPPPQALQRVAQRCAPNHFEQLDYLQRVAEVFETMNFPYLRRLQGTLPAAALHARIWREVQALLAPQD
jgi:dTMP kinase